MSYRGGVRGLPKHFSSLLPSPVWPHSEVGSPAVRRQVTKRTRRSRCRPPAARPRNGAAEHASPHKTPVGADAKNDGARSQSAAELDNAIFELCRHIVLSPRRKWGHLREQGLSGAPRPAPARSGSVGEQMSRRVGSERGNWAKRGKKTRPGTARLARGISW